VKNSGEGDDCQPSCFLEEDEEVAGVDVQGGGDVIAVRGKLVQDNGIGVVPFGTSLGNEPLNCH
jgi:hypothetical protein